MIDLKKYYKQTYKKKKKKAIKILKSFENKETSIEKKVREYLTEEGIFFVQEYGVNYEMKGKKIYKVYDFYVSGVNEKGFKFDFLIETHGRYWHAFNYCEGLVSYSNLTKLQKRNLKNDKLKRSIAKAIGMPLLTLWEDEINKDFSLVIEKIYKSINYL